MILVQHLMKKYQILKQVLNKYKKKIIHQVQLNKMIQ